MTSSVPWPTSNSLLITPVKWNVKVDELQKRTLIWDFSSHQLRDKVTCVVGDDTTAVGDVPDEPDAHHDAPESSHTSGKSSSVQITFQYSSFHYNIFHPKYKKNDNLTYERPTDLSASPTAQHEFGRGGGGHGLCGDGGLGRRRSRGRREERREDASRGLAVSLVAGE